MAFQAGTQVDPRLMQADYSGFARAAQINAQAMANLGEQIGSAVTKYAVNKQKNEDKKLRYESILPYTTSMFGAEEGEKMAKTFSNDPKLGAQILEFAGMQQDQAALQKAVAVSTTPEGRIDPSIFLSSFINLGGRNVEGAVKFASQAREAEEGQYKDAKIPTDIQVSEYEAKLFEKARQAYNQNDDTTATTILLRLGATSNITGQPLPLEDVFGERKPLPESEVPSISDSGEGGQTTTSLDDLVSKYQQ
jgi:hypothetical protein